MLAACHRGPQAASAGHATPAPHPSARAPRAAADDIAGFVEAPSVGKSVLALKLEFSPEARPVAGTPLAIDLAVIPANSVGSGTLTVGADPSFVVAAAQHSRALPALGAGSAYRTRVLVTPTAPGVQTLELDLTLTDAAGSTQGRYALPLIVAAR